MTRLQLFWLGLQKCLWVLAQYPESTALVSIARQIEYLIGIEDGTIVDRSRLGQIIIGVLTAREIEPLDNDAAEIFYKIAGEAKQM